jgi:pyruvate kinase
VERPLDPRRTKIVATIGPASGGADTIAALVEAGANAARLNFSHGTHEQHAEWARLVREVERESGWRTLALIADLQGPKLRVIDLDAPVTLAAGDEIVVAGENGYRSDLQIAPSVISEVLQAGDEILIDDGHIRLRVERVAKGRAHCAVVAGGIVTANKGVNLPGVPLPIPAITRKDVEDLELALELGVDFVALSFVRSAADVLDLRKLISENGSTARVIAKIEKAEAVECLDAVLDVADAMMVARGDLGVEIGPAAVPLIQKQIIQRSLQRGLPVITATQMLESMIGSPEPTRAEASDVANAILDGTSAIMLSGETAIGSYPVEAVATMDAIACAVEPSLDYRHQLPEAGDNPSIGWAMSNAACDLAEVLGAKAVLVPTSTGRTASAVARLRPHRPILGLSHHPHALHHMALEWGVTPMQIEAAEDIEGLWQRSIDAARQSGIVDDGDRVVLTAGTAVNVPGTTNVIKVEIV